MRSLILGVLGDRGGVYAGPTQRFLTTDDDERTVVRWFLVCLFFFVLLFFCMALALFHATQFLRRFVSARSLRADAKRTPHGMADAFHPRWDERVFGRYQQPHSLVCLFLANPFIEAHFLIKSQMGFVVCRSFGNG